MQSFLQYREIGRYTERELHNLSGKGRTRSAGDESYHQPRHSSDSDLEAARATLKGDTVENHSRRAASPHSHSPLSSDLEDALEKAVPQTSNSPSGAAVDTSHFTHRDDGKIEVKSSGPDDPTNPLNWPLRTRCWNLAVLFCLVFVQAWAGACDSQANRVASRQFHVSRTAEDLDTAMYLIGIGAGALFAGPLSEAYGRNIMYMTTTFCYLLFVLGTALAKNFDGQIVCRSFVGLFAATTLTINGSSVSDQFGPLERSLTFPLIALPNVAAPALAPIAGGWIASNPRLGYAWTEWVTLIISAAAFLLALFLLPETYQPLLVKWKTDHLRRLKGNDGYTCGQEEEGSVVERLKDTLPRPVIFFTREPVIIVLGTYLILLYVLVFTFLSGFDYIFTQTYNFSSGYTGSCFAAIASGELFGTVISLFFYLVDRRAFRKHGSIPPETRLWPSIIAAPFLPISLFWLGWMNYKTISPWSGLLACFVFGYVVIVIYVSSYLYIIDSYATHAASALASITMIRYLVAAGMVMAARPMYMGIGVHWTLTLLGCLGVVLTPAPLILWKVGPKVREKSKYAKSE